jgi:hypothetical protein
MEGMGNAYMMRVTDYMHAYNIGVPTSPLFRFSNIYPARNTDYFSFFFL